MIEKIPNGIVDYKSPFKIKGERILVINDTHIPYHYKKGLELAVEYGVKKEVDTIVLNGDFLDMYQISRFDRSPDKRPVSVEIQTGLRVLEYIRKKYPDQNIVFVEGNHEERLSKYVNKNSELFGIPEIELRSLLKLDDFGIEFINEKRFLKAGELIICHGHELGLSTGGVNPARSTLLKTFSNCLFGHFHKTSEYITSKLDGSLLGCWSVGHLSDPHPKYMPVNMWNWGFAFVEVKGKEFEVHNKKIFNGKVF
jgi:predicted phosphodiesterase